MALVNCTIDKRSVLLAKGSAVGGSSTVTLEIKPVAGHVVAASDFTNNTTIASPIQSITLSDSGTAYDVNNEVNVVVALQSGFTPTVDQTLVIDIDGEATRVDLIPITVNGEFTGNSLTDVTSTTSSVRVDDNSLSGDYNLIENPFETHVFATITVAPTLSTRFFETEPTIQVTNSSYTGIDLNDQYIFTYVDTFNSDGFHTQRVYTCSIIMPQVARSGDNISITATSALIPTSTNFIRGYQMNTTDSAKVSLNRTLAVLGDPGVSFKVRIERGTLSGSTFTPDSTDRYYVWDQNFTTVADAYQREQFGSETFTIPKSGVSRVNVLIPGETVDGISYQFSIVPQGGSNQIIPEALGYVSAYLMQFYIGRLKDVKFEVDAVSSNASITKSIVYKNYLGETMNLPPGGLSNSEKGTTTAKYDFEISIDSNKNFYLFNDSGNDVLSLDLNSGGVGSQALLLNSNNVTGTNIVDPFELEEGDVNVTIGNTATQTVVDFTQATILGASAEANELGISGGRAIGYTTSTAATGAASTISAPGTTAGNEIAIDLTLQEREALTNSSFVRLSDQEFKILGRRGYFVISYYSANVLRKGVTNLQTIPVAKTAVVLVGRSRKFLPLDFKGGTGPSISSQTLLIFPNRGYISNSTGTTPSSAIDRTKMLIKGTNFYIQNYGNSDAKYTFNVDNFSQSTLTSEAAPSQALSLTHGIPQFNVKEYSNSQAAALAFNGSITYPLVTYSVSISVDTDEPNPVTFSYLDSNYVSQTITVNDGASGTIASAVINSVTATSSVDDTANIDIDYTPVVSAVSSATTSLVYHIVGLEIFALDGLPSGFNASNITASNILLSVLSSSSSEFLTNSTTITVSSLGNVSVTNASLSTRKLTIGTISSPLKITVANYTTLPTSGAKNLNISITVELDNGNAPVLTNKTPTSGGEFLQEYSQYAE
jgi:hypothetical protein